jgi:ATP-dependent helicase/DNAse subunit B
MKTIIADNSQKDQILHDAALKNNGIAADLQVLSLSAVMKEERDDRISVLLSLKKILSKHPEDYPIYGAMFAYPAFLEDILVFAKECMLWGIQEEDLPADTDAERELRKILAAVFAMDLAEKKTHAQRDQILTDLQGQDIVLYPSFYTNQYHYEVFQQLKQSFPMYETRSASPKKELYYSLNMRKEIESAAQSICRRNQTCNIILCDYSNQYPVLKQVFQRYGIPFACLKEEQMIHIPMIYASLCTFAYKKDRSSFLQVLKQNAFSQECPRCLADYIAQKMNSDELPSSVYEAVQNGPFSAEAKIYQRYDAECASYLQKIKEEYDLLSSSHTPQEIFANAYTVMLRSPYLKQDKEFKAGMQIRSALQNVLPSLQEDEISFFIELFSSMKDSSSSYATDFCAVSDLQHPLSQRQDTYLLGCSESFFPGFPAKKGLFDEAYIKRTHGYPSLAARHTSYMEQLQWIAESAENTIFYSYATNDYAGHELQLALDAESLFPKNSAKKWPLDTLVRKASAPHALSKETAQELFVKDGQIHGSISTIERWFACPYAYFIQSGLGIRKNHLSTNDAASIGTIQHAVMEHAVKTKQKEYPEISEEEVRAFIAPYFEAMQVTHPNDAEQINATKERLVQGMMISFFFLKDMEKDTSFVPAQAESHFEEEIVPGVTLKGVIDRMDECNDLVRIIDYKSSDHALSEKGVKAGQYLQLLSYLMIAEKKTQLKPAGCYYFSLKETPSHLAAASVSRLTVTDTEINEENFKDTLVKQRRMRGWTFADRLTELDENSLHIVGLKSIMDHDLVQECIKELYGYFRDSLTNGNIALSPTEGACTFCDYRSVCRFHGEYRKIVPLLMKEESFKCRKEGK